jgi:uncharacterized membrane protein required for colicin V production
MIAFLCAMMLSQPVLAYRQRSLDALMCSFSQKTPDVVIYLIIVCVVITVASVILSFVVKGKTSVTLRLIGAVTSIIGVFFITFFSSTYPLCSLSWWTSFKYLFMLMGGVAGGLYFYSYSQAKKIKE